MATNDDMFSSGSNGDSGPTVRRMSLEVRSHAREVLLAEALSDAAGQRSQRAQADNATTGRAGFDGAPAPLKKRWMVLAAGLAVAAAGAAIIVGSGVISGDDIGLSPAGPTSSQDDAESGGVSAAEPDGNLDLLQTRVTCLSSVGAPSNDTSSVVFEHQTADYTMVAVDLGIPQMCATPAEGGFIQSEGRTLSGELSQFMRYTSAKGDLYTEILGGKVADDMTAVDIQSDGDVVASAHVENGWFSAFVTTGPGAELSYLVTLQDGSNKAVVVDDRFYRDPAEQEARYDAQIEELADECFEDDVELIAAHPHPSYDFFAGDTGDTIEGCLSTFTLEEKKWTAVLPATMPPTALIQPMEPTPGATDTGPYPVMGRAAPSVTEVVVVLADNRRRDAYVQDGFYSLALPATDAADLTYVVSTDDGETTTIGSE